MYIKRIGVVGGGAIGRDIAELFAIYNYNVVLNDVDEDILMEALEKIRCSLEEMEREKGLIGLKEYVLSNIMISTSLRELGEKVDYIIETVPENLEIKRDVFSELDKYCKINCIFASNTSTIPIGEIAEATNRKDRVIGLHFPNPPIIIPAVEIILSSYTSETTKNITKKLVESIGREYVIVKKDVPGFIVNRINLRVFSEALKLVEEGIDYKLIDAAIIHRLGFPKGIFEVIDQVGVDVVLNILRGLNKHGFKIEYPNILDELITSSRIGLKSGWGFYKYKDSNIYSKPKILTSEDIYNIDLLRILSTGINEAVYLLREEVGTAEDIDKAMKLIMNYPKGILEYADEFGLDIIYDRLNNLYEAYGKEYYKPDEYLKSLVNKGKYGVKTGEGVYKWRFERFSFGPIDYTKLHDYALIKMNRAKKLNALNEDMWKGLENAFSKADEDEDIRAIVLTGGGRAFSAGDDISVMRSWKSAIDAREFFNNYARPFIEKMLMIKKPVIIAVNGLAFGGGMEIVLLGDIIISRDDVEFSIPESLIGAFPPIASSIGFVIFGRKILRYAVTGERLNSEKAKELGFVDIVVKKDMLWPIVIEFIDKIRKSSPLGVKAVKRISNSIKKYSWQFLSNALEELVFLSATEDFKEGMKAFLQKRTPKWRGK